MPKLGGDLLMRRRILSIQSEAKSETETKEKEFAQESDSTESEKEQQAGKVVNVQENLSNESETDGSPSKEQNDNITKPMDTSDAVRVAP